MGVIVQFSPQRFAPPAAAAAELEHRMLGWSGSDLLQAGEPQDGLVKLHLDAGGYRFECLGDPQRGLLVVVRWEAADASS